MSSAPIFFDRTEAGKVLAEQLRGVVPPRDLLVLALPRGGVPVAFEVAKTFSAPLDIVTVRKLGVPGEEELAIGAIASGGIRFLDEAFIARLKLPRSVIDQITDREERELKRREELYRQGRPAATVTDRTVVLIDDGLATGATMKAAARAVRMQGPKQIIVAVPVAAAQSCRELSADVHEVVCAYTPKPFIAVGLWYRQFRQISDEEVQNFLRQAQATAAKES
jgi:putative phosphoribosyl transferase